MDQELLNKFAEQDRKLDAIFKSAEKTRKIFMWTLIITIATIVLPIIGLLFVLPYYLSTINLSGLGLGI
jgi:hypothetical protein